MTPYEIGILLHYYSTCGEHPHAPIFKDTVSGLMDDGLMDYEAPTDTDLREPRIYRLTKKGSFYVEHGLCKVPLPIHKYEIPWGSGYLVNELGQATAK